MDKLDINTASVEEIANKVAMIGREKAEAIVAYREQRGPFTAFTDLKHVPGFSDKLVESMELFFTIHEHRKLAHK